jgi:hypothetical protein
MRFCNGLTAKGEITFSPGLYIIENGGFSVGGSIHVQGSGVTFYFVNGGNVQLSGDGLVNLSAPTSGPYSGILFFGSRTTAGSSQSLTGNTGSTFQGAVYMPASDVTFTGSSSTASGCTQIIGRTVTFTGNSNLRSNCSTAGTATIFSNETVAIVE